MMAENNKRVLYFFPRLERRCEEICDRFSNSWLDGSSKKAKILNLLQKTRSSHDNNHLNDLQLTLLAMMQLKSIFNQHRHLHSKVLSILFKTSPTSSKTFKRYMLTFFKSLDEDEHLNSSSTWESIQKFFQHNDKYIAKKHNVLIEKIQRPTNNHQMTTRIHAATTPYLTHTMDIHPSSMILQTRMTTSNKKTALFNNSSLKPQKPTA